MNSAGKRIAEARVAKGMNQSALARALGVTPQAVQRWESGGGPKRTRLLKVAQVLGTTIEYLLVGQTSVAIKYGDRLKKAREHVGLTQAGLADAIGNACSQENISKLEHRDATGSEFTSLFARACGVNHFWLATGNEEMLPGEPGASSRPTPMQDFSRRDFEFIKRVNDLPAECRRSLEILLSEQERLLTAVSKQKADAPEMHDEYVKQHWKGIGGKRE